MRTDDNGGAAIRLTPAMMRPGTRVACEFVNVAERLWVSDGVRQVDGEVVAGETYRRPSFAPVLPARAPEANEVEILTCPVSCHEEHIELLRAPAHVTEVMQYIQENGGTRSAFTRACETSEVAGRLEEWIESLYDVSDFDCCGPWMNPGGMPTVTRSIQGLVGLHVDNQDKAVNGLLCGARRRFSINLGCHDRYLLYVNWSVDHVHGNTDLMARGASASQRGPWQGLVDAFLAAYPDYPVVWLRVRPGEAYVAPLGNLIHDASSLGMKGPDLTFSVLGHFRSKR